MPVSGKSLTRNDMHNTKMCRLNRLQWLIGSIKLSRMATKAAVRIPEQRFRKQLFFFSPVFQFPHCSTFIDSEQHLCWEKKFQVHKTTILCNNNQCIFLYEGTFGAIVLFWTEKEKYFISRTFKKKKQLINSNIYIGNQLGVIKSELKIDVLSGENNWSTKFKMNKKFTTKNRLASNAYANNKPELLCDFFSFARHF